MSPLNRLMARRAAARESGFSADVPELLNPEAVDAPDFVVWAVLQRESPSSDHWKSITEENALAKVLTPYVSLVLCADLVKADT